MLVNGSTIPYIYELYYNPYIESFADKKNLLEFDDIEETTTNGITYSIKNGVLKFKGSSTAPLNLFLKLKNKISKNTIVTSNLFGDKWAYPNNIYLSGTTSYDKTTTFYKRDNLPITFTTEYDYGYLLIQFNYSNVDLTLKPMLIKGKTAPTTFLPYQDKYSAFLNVKGKNLIGLDNQTLEINGIKVQIKDGVITVNGVSSDRNVSAEINLKNSIGSGTYSFNAFTTVGSRIDVYMNAPLVSLADLSINTTKTNVSLTSATQLILYFPKGIQYDNRVLKPMLIEGNTAPTEYEPYYSFTKELLIKQPLRKFDYLTYDGVYRQTNEIVLDGSWNVVENNYLFKNGWFVVANVDNCFPARSDWGEPFSKLYSVTTSDLPLISFYEMVDGGNKKGIAIENAKIRIHLDDSADNSLNNWTVEKVNNYFKQNPITITYKTVDQTFEATSLTRLLFKNGYNKITAFDSINNNAIVEYLEYYKSKGD
jgi:hypothetical protein